MKNRQPAKTPKTIAKLKSKITVAIIVKKNKHKAVWKRFWKNSLITDHSFIRHAVTTKTPANAGMGILDMTGDKSNIDNNKKTA